MASHTENLNLLKKDPTADGSDTFNIKTMLNENWDKVDANAARVAAELAGKVNWSGQIINESVLAWADAQVLPTTCASVGDATDLPHNGGKWMISVELYMWSAWRRLTATHVNTGDHWENTRDSEGNWYGWTRVTTATPPEEYDLPCTGGHLFLRKDQFGRVTIDVQITGASIPAGTLIATLPNGYAPKRNTKRTVPADDGSTENQIYMTVLADGGVYLSGYEPAWILQTCFSEAAYWSG